MRLMTLSLLCLIALGFTGCATRLDGDRYRDDTPAFNLFTFFEGPTKAWGIVQNRDGEVVQRFTVDISGTITGDTLRLDETFNYQLGDGVKARTWAIRRLGDGTYTGGAGDIVGSATGESHGNAFRWSYEMDLPVGDNEFRVRFEDWIWALDDRTIVNRSYIQKLGLDFAEVTIFMQRQD